MDVEFVLKNVLKKITPTKKEEKKIKRTIENVVKITEQILKPLNLTFTLAGSYIRNTYVLDKKEFDIFILFPESTDRVMFEKMGLDIGKKIVKRLGGVYKIAYAEHPYIRAVINDYDVDIVPCYKLKSVENIKSSVDRTPFHNEWLKKHLKKKHTGEVRLLKQFLKGCKIYGSDTKTEGFSGYLCELLIIKFGSFRKLVEHVKDWNPGDVIIDLESHHADLSKIKEMFYNQPLIVIDPVDPKRNVASVLSPANFIKFRKMCREFLQKPSENFFFPKYRISLVQLKRILKERGTEFIGISFKRPDIIDDILYPQLRKSSRRIKGILEDCDFKIMGFDIWTNKVCIMMFEMEIWNLPKIKKVIGPPIFSKKHSKEFIDKYKKEKIWVEGDRYVAETKRKFLTAKEKLKDILSKNAEELKSEGIASYVSQSIANGYTLLDENELLKYAKRDKDFKSFFAYYLKKHFY